MHIHNKCYFLDPHKNPDAGSIRETKKKPQMLSSSKSTWKRSKRHPISCVSYMYCIIVSKALKGSPEWAIHFILSILLAPCASY